MNDDTQNDNNMTAELLKRLADLLRDYGVLRQDQHREVLGRIDSQYRTPK